MKIIDEKCQKCGACASVCPVEAIKDFQIDSSICVGCGCCMSECSEDAITDED